MALIIEEHWEQPESEVYHAHFDCFSGAAGDMMLSACLDAAGDDREKLLKHITRCLEQGMPDLKGEFSILPRQVWRGIGSISGLHIQVQSKYNHAAAPVPSSVHDHNHDNGSSHSHQHQHEHQHEQQYRHEHEHEHEHHHSHQASSPPEGKSADKSQEQQEDESAGHHSHTHSHSQGTHSHGSQAHTHSHAHESSSSIGPLRNLPEIKRMLNEAPTEFIPNWVKEKGIKAFTELARAEARTHGATTIEDVHFHEVGAVDSIVDTIGTLLALHALGVATISCSRLPLGEGTVWTDHGLLPVPAPATLRLMVGMPTCPGPKGITGELVTPTAAALLRVLVQSSPSSQVLGRPPAFTPRKIGIGAGTKDFEKHPNILRLILGDTVDEGNQK
jgi:uncharacterized protein (DUF111 family)